MLERVWQKMDELFSVMDVEIKQLFDEGVEAGSKTRTHRIVSKNGHITITGDFKTLTVNGKKVDASNANPGRQG